MDFLGHLVDAPFANILIIAGLLFLGIGVVGKITGKIEPSTMGRLMASLLGLVLLAAGVATHIKGDSSNKNQSALVVRAFSVTPAEVTKGSTVTISWDVLNADDVEIEPFGQVPPSGDRVVQPGATTTYRLSATNRGGGKSGTFQEVIVDQPKRKSTAGVVPSTPRPPDNPPPGDGGSRPAEDQDSQGDPIYASQPPPPLPDYQQPPDPGGNAIWTPGSWYYNTALLDYYWVPGAWVTSPNFEVWTPPYWGYDSTRYQWHPGYWSTSVGFYGGIDYGFGYSGTRYDRSRNKSRNPVSYNGGLGGVKKQPPPLQLAANRDRIPVLGAQKKLARDAKKNPEQYSKVNHGRPLIVVAKLPRLPLQTDHPGDADKAMADKVRADADKARADKARADAEKARVDKAKADADKARADKAKADKAKVDADKAGRGGNGRSAPPQQKTPRTPLPPPQKPPQPPPQPKPH
jgi:WXXGXW repeat (2 copies)